MTIVCSNTTNYLCPEHRIIELERMLIRLTEGWLMAPHEIREYTGLPEHECEELSKKLSEIYSHFKFYN